MPTADAEIGRTRSSVTGSALWRWARESRPEHVELLEQARKSCMTSGTPWGCFSAQGYLYTRDGEPKKGLPEPIKARALQICEATLECDDILMMLDKDHYPVEAVAPVEKRVGEILVDACLDGACTCGRAVRHLEAGDARRAALAQAGCDDGEAEGCYELALLHEAGTGVPRDEARAFQLYELACPAMRPIESIPGPRQGDYSPRACDRLAQKYERGAMPPKQKRHAFYYAEAACQNSGFERDHQPCLRLARYHAHDVDTGRNIEDAHDASMGFTGHPVNRKECARPSVAAACAELEKEIGKIRR